MRFKLGLKKHKKYVFLQDKRSLKCCITSMIIKLRIRRLNVRNPTMFKL
jgi:hypothetical protein